MTHQATHAPVRKSITVEASQERAFEVFTRGVDTWWPKDGSHHLGDVELEAAVIEPRAGGRYYQRTIDGAESEWGQVLEWEPPSRIVLAWQLDHEWTYQEDMGLATEVEVRFVPVGPGSTRVELEHRGFERHGEHADAIRVPVDGPGGWGALLEAYSEAARRAR